MSGTFLRVIAISSLILIFSLSAALPAAAWQQDAPAVSSSDESWRPLTFLFGLIHQILQTGDPAPANVQPPTGGSEGNTGIPLAPSTDEDVGAQIDPTG
jgi:hypothetical protein